MKTDFDRATDFGRYKTFCWQNVETRNPLWIERIKTAVGSALTAKGWSQAESGSARDVAVVAMEIKRNHDTVNTFDDNFKRRLGWLGLARIRSRRFWRVNHDYGDEEGKAITDFPSQRLLATQIRWTKTP